MQMGDFMDEPEKIVKFFIAKLSQYVNQSMLKPETSKKSKLTEEGKSSSERVL